MAKVSSSGWEMFQGILANTPTFSTPYLQQAYLQQVMSQSLMNQMQAQMQQAQLQQQRQIQFHELVRDYDQRRHRCVFCGKVWTDEFLVQCVNPSFMRYEPCDPRSAVTPLMKSKDEEPIYATPKETDPMIYDAIFVKKASKKSKDEEGATDEIIFECRVISETEPNAYWRAFIKYCEKHEAPEGSVLLTNFDPKMEITLRPFRGGA